VIELTGSTVGQRYEFEPKIWDPQAATDTIQATFSSPMGSLPHWLHWEDGQRLVGVPDAPMPGFTVFVIADVSPFRLSKAVLMFSLSIVIKCNIHSICLIHSMR
jgi:hypothetical protein